MLSDEWKGNLSLSVIELIEDKLIDGEQVLEVSKISKGIYWQCAVLFAITFLLATFIAVELAYVLGTAAFSNGLYAFLRKKIYVIVLTDKRVMARSGLIQMELVDIRFDKIESVESEQMLTGYMMGYAKLVVMGTGNRYISIPYIENARSIRKKMNEILLKD